MATDDEQLWVAEKLAMEVLKAQGAIIQDGWICWDIPWDCEDHTPTDEAATKSASARWHAVNEATTTQTLPVPGLMQIEGAGGPSLPEPAKKKKKTSKKPVGDKEFNREYWPEKGVDKTSAHFQWNYGRWGGSMGWAACTPDLQKKLDEAIMQGTSELTYSDREK